MRICWLTLVVVFFNPVVSVFAQESATKTKIEDVVPADKESDDDDDVDTMITNSAMRADSGSKSKWSIASSLNYAGGSIEKPLAEDRPNISGVTGTTDKSLIDGQISV